MTYLKKAHQELLRDSCAIIEARESTLTEEELKTLDLLKKFIADSEEENTVRKKAALVTTKAYRENPRNQKKIKKQNHKAYVKRKQRTKEQQQETGNA